MDIIYWLFSADRQLSAALRLWQRGERGRAIRVARWASRKSGIAKLMLAQWLIYPGSAREVHSPSEGIQLLREAIALGVPEAYQVLAGCYLSGEGVNADRDVAVQLLEESAKCGLLSAWQELVHLYTDGKHFDPDYVRALQYANELATAGYPQMRDALRAETLGT